MDLVKGVLGFLALPAFVLVLALTGNLSGDTARRVEAESGRADALSAKYHADRRDEVEAYCRYGAVSRAQLRGCVAHVTGIARVDTHAAAYAAGRIGCLADSGPYCR